MVSAGLRQGRSASFAQRPLVRRASRCRRLCGAPVAFWVRSIGGCRSRQHQAQPCVERRVHLVAHPVRDRPPHRVEQLLIDHATCHERGDVLLRECIKVDQHAITSERAPVVATDDCGQLACSARARRRRRSGRPVPRSARRDGRSASPLPIGGLSHTGGWLGRRCVIAHAPPPGALKSIKPSGDSRPCVSVIDRVHDSAPVEGAAQELIVMNDPACKARSTARPVGWSLAAMSSSHASINFEVASPYAACSACKVGSVALIRRSHSA